MKKLYLAYGSNLNLGQMAQRCPTAMVLGAAQLNGWRLTFRGFDGGAVANIEQEKESEVPVLIWELEPADEEALDIYEGFPFLYRKVMVTVVFEGKPIEAMAYIMVRHVRNLKGYAQSRLKIK